MVIFGNVIRFPIGSSNFAPYFWQPKFGYSTLPLLFPNVPRDQNEKIKGEGEEEGRDSNCVIYFWPSSVWVIEANILTNFRPSNRELDGRERESGKESSLFTYSLSSFLRSVEWTRTEPEKINDSSPSSSLIFFFPFSLHIPCAQIVLHNPQSTSPLVPSFHFALSPSLASSLFKNRKRAKIWKNCPIRLLRLTSKLGHK